MPGKFYFFVDEEQKLNWSDGGEPNPTLGNQQATIVAIANLSSAIQHVADQIYNTLDALREREEYSQQAVPSDVEVLASETPVGTDPSG